MKRKGPAPSPPIKYLLECSGDMLGNFELAKMGEVSNMRSEMLALFDRLVDVSAQACLAHWLRTIDRNELRRRLTESPETTFELVMAEAKEQIRNSGRSQEEAEDYASPRPQLSPEERRERHSRRAMDWERRNLVAGKCQGCTEPLCGDSIRYCAKHLAMKRDRQRRYREQKGVLIGMHGRHPNTIKAFKEESEKRKRMKPLSLHMPDKAHAMTQAELLKNTCVSKTTVRKALRQLLDAGRIQRIGAGSLREPYRYFAK